MPACTTSPLVPRLTRSEERRVGKERRSRGSPNHLKKEITTFKRTDVEANPHLAEKLRLPQKMAYMRGSGSKTMKEIAFFQAENGIRDTSVTGVQTCALPI